LFLSAMNSFVSRYKLHFANWRRWELNPIVVKELRQSVRSWAVTGMLLLFLAVLFCTSLVFLISQSFQVSANQRLGADIFQTFTVILTGASLLFIPLYIGVRIASERQDSNLDLLYITTLTPGRIVRGKFLCGAYVTVLFFSACMPFMAFTNLLRGVDLPTVFFVLVCLFLVVCAAVQVAIFVACLPVSRVLKILVALFGTIGMFPLIGALVALFFGMMRSGVGSMIVGGAHFWPGFFTGAGVVFAGVLLLYFLSVAMISPPSANRALPVRIYVTLVWLLGALIAFGWAWKQNDERYLLPWAFFSFVVLSAAMIVVISNYDQLSLRVRRQIPAAAGKRALAFLFYNGAAGGLVWVILLMAATFAVTSAFMHLPFIRIKPVPNMSAEDVYEFDLTAAAAVLYVIAYGLTALLIHRRFFGTRSPRLAGVLAVLLPSMWAVVPPLALFFLNRLSDRAMERNQLGSIFNLLFNVKDPGQKFAHLACGGVWLLLMVILNAKWFVQQLRHFQPLNQSSEPPKPVPAPVPPPIPGQTGIVGK
jgi:hypothetical protein